MYKVIREFADLSDDGHVYRAGDVFPRLGAKDPERDRIAELSGSGNKIGCPLIEEAPEEKPEEKPVRRRKR